jgi:hypothetical protein
MQWEMSTFIAKSIMGEHSKEIRTEENTACWEDQQMKPNNKVFP